MVGSSHFACITLASIVTGVFIPKRVYYSHNVMVSVRKKKKKFHASLLSISFVAPCYAFKKMKAHKNAHIST